jgi:hypothetical protein
MISHELRRSEWSKESWIYFQPSSIVSMFRGIKIGFAGKSKECVYIYSFLAYTAKFHVKGLCELKLATEVATDADTGWSEILNMEQLGDWMQSLEKELPSILRTCEQLQNKLYNESAAKALEVRNSILSSVLMEPRESSYFQCPPPSEVDDLLNSAGMMQIRNQEIYRRSIELVCGSIGPWENPSRGVFEDKVRYYAVQLVADSLLST